MKKQNKKMQKKYVMYERSCPKSVPGLTWSNATKYQQSNPNSNIYTLSWDRTDTVFNIKSKWSIDFECPHTVYFLSF